MAEVKLDERELEQTNPPVKRVEQIAAILPKPNPYLLEKLQSQIQELDDARIEVQRQKEISKLTPKEKREYEENQVELKKQAEELSKPAAEAAPKEAKPDNSFGSWATYLFKGAEPKEIADVAIEKIEQARKGAGDLYTAATGREHVLPFSFSKIDPDPDRALKDAEVALYVHKYRTRKLLEEIKEKMNPFSLSGQQISYEGAPKNRDEYQGRSAQESTQILASVLTVLSDLAQKHDDPSLKADQEKLASFLQIGSNLSKQEYESIGFSFDNSLTDEQVAAKWGLIKSKQGHLTGLSATNGNFPEMFFEVQKLLTSYNVMQTLTSVEKELESLLKDVESNSSLGAEEKKAERRKIWTDIIAARITGAVSKGNDLDGIKTQVNENAYGVILIPMLFAKEGGMSVGEATIFRLLVEKAKRESVGDAFAKEQADRILDTYESAEREGKIRDLVETKYKKKASELSDEELDKALVGLRFEADYTKANSLYQDINKSLPSFIELSHILVNFNHTIEPPAAIDNAVKNKADFDLLMKEIRAAREQVRVLIEDKLELTPERAIELADQFVKINQGNLSEQATQIPARIRTISEKTFGYKEKTK